MTREEAIKLICPYANDGRTVPSRIEIIDDLIKLGVLKVEEVPDQVRVVFTRIDGKDHAIVSVIALANALATVGYEVTLKHPNLNSERHFKPT